MPQTLRLSTKARESMEALADLLAHIAHDGVFTAGEWAACERQLREALSLVEQTDDALAIGLALLKGGPESKQARTLARNYGATHGTVIELHTQRRHRGANHDDAA